MANTKSALKRIKLTQRDTLRNQVNKSVMKTSIKTFLKSYEDCLESFSLSKKELLKKNLSIACSKIDKAKNQGIIHKNTARRKKAALQYMYNKVPQA